MPVRATDQVDLTSTDERTIVDLSARGLAPLRVLGRYRYLRAHPPIPLTRHRSLLVLALPTRGVFSFDVDGAPQLVRPGEVLRLPPGRTYRTGGTAEPRGALTWLIAQVRDGSAALDRALAVLASHRPPPTWSAPAEARAALGRAFTVAAGERDWIADGLLRHLLTAAVLDLTGALTRPAPPESVEHRAVTTLLRWIDQNLTEPVEAADLVARSGLSASRFYQAFQLATGTSPKDYLLRRKVAYAHDWLRRDPVVTVTTVAHALGFSSSQHFATVYRRYHGVAPSASR